MKQPQPIGNSAPPPKPTIRFRKFSEAESKPFSKESWRAAMRKRDAEEELQYQLNRANGNRQAPEYLMALTEYRAAEKSQAEIAAAEAK